MRGAQRLRDPPWPRRVTVRPHVSGRVCTDTCVRVTVSRLYQPIRLTVNYPAGTYVLGPHRLARILLNHIDALEPANPDTFAGQVVLGSRAAARHAWPHSPLCELALREGPFRHVLLSLSLALLIASRLTRAWRRVFPL